MSTRVASCCCGQLKVTTTAEPLRVGICHCWACQQRTGSVFAVQARFSADQVAVAGDFTTYTRIGDEGTRVTFRFCPHCGSTVCWQLEGDEDQVAVAVGAFADSAFPGPASSVYEERMHHWVQLPSGITHMD